MNTVTDSYSYHAKDIRQRTQKSVCLSYQNVHSEQRINHLVLFFNIRLL